METTPSAAELIAAATEALRDELLPALTGRAAFQARVVANVLDIARRELERGPAADAAELARLTALLGADPAGEAAGAAMPRALAPGDGPLPGLRAALCDALRTGRVTLDTPGLAGHLWADAMARLAIEQPGYPSYLRELRHAASPPA
jgi:hypothetical protein